MNARGCVYETLDVGVGCQMAVCSSFGYLYSGYLYSVAVAVRVMYLNFPRVYVIASASELISIIARLRVY